MRLALIFTQEDYNDAEQDLIDIQAVEVVDPTLTSTSEAGNTTFNDPINNVVYVRKNVDVAEDAFKCTIISNYSDCKYKKSTGVIVPSYTTPANRQIKSDAFLTRYPMMTDQYFVPFAGSGVGPEPEPGPEPPPEPEPCDESPRVLASYITNCSMGKTTWDLTQYQGDGIGCPGQQWCLRDVGERHHISSEFECTGTVYRRGIIDENGKLVGLPDEFVSSYYYNGYMEIQQGQVDEYGNVTWPCPNYY